MKYFVRIYFWEPPIICESDLDVMAGDRVIVNINNTSEIGTVESGDEPKDDPNGKITRLADDGDGETYKQNEKEKNRLIEVCKEETKKLALEMKIIDVRISFDGKQIIFVFTADGRVDFRELVKNLSRELKRAIRMQQIGSRDETRHLGGYGICGRTLCCANYSGNMQSITTEMARVQQIAHRGTERISGLCGRLMCCLAYEADQYKEMLKDMPEMYSVVSTTEGKGTVIEVNAITQDIKVKLEKGKYITLKKEELK